ncbi:MAG: hypothetical protein DRP67_01450 [Candidatus Omnitrophota bacterium]|nr:MAG: hypothetical protein DRP67_01450 [Candidatus Omnitrophota bacterium]HDN97620.1 ABC transporter ATP-binding protein [bacterium]
MSNLRGENLWKIYGEVEAIRGVNIEVEEGEIVVIFGPSGSGKTTLLNLLALLDKPTRGRIYLDGRDITDIGEREASEIRNRNFGFIFQLFHLIPELTVIENVYLPLWIREKNNFKINQYKKDAERLLEEFGIGEKANLFPSQLSTGEKQKVAICRSLICKPNIIFADEPTGSIDKDSARVFFEMVKYLNEKMGITFVIVTHNEKFLHLATKAVYLNEGIIKRVEKIKKG